MKPGDVLALAYRTVSSNKLRTGITVAIIAFGIMALIGIITAITAMNQSLTENFSFLGANAFSIRYKERQVHIGGNQSRVTRNKRGERKEKTSNIGKFITQEHAEQFRENYHFPAQVGLQLQSTSPMVVKYESTESNPDVRGIGGDEHFLAINGYSLNSGRNFNSLDVQSARNVCLLGSDVAKLLFPRDPDNAVDKIIRIANLPYRVIGVMKPKGASAFLKMDKVVVTTHTNIKRLPNASPTYTINVMVDDIHQLDPAIGEATALLRAVRKLQVTEAENFYIDKSDSVAEMMITLLGSISGAAGAIGLITLVGAAIGLMNIMLVAVTERTKEVGLIKALGGTRKSIRNQFLFESVIISLLGAAFGILLGVLVGNLFSMVLETGFVVPWGWVLTGIIICSLVGLAAGLWPAIKASKLDPIVALRYE